MNNIEIKEKANYCIGCIKKPCQEKCPLNNDTTGFIKLIKEEKYKEAYELLCETTVLQSICGRICPHSKQCRSGCIRGLKGEPVSIGELESFIGDLAIQENWNIPAKNPKQERIAVVGSGPASLTCAAFLAKEGYQVTIYEKHNYLGGLLRHGIPEFRLPKTILDKTINKILSLGIKVEQNKELGTNLNLSSLEKDYDAIFIGIGANISKKLNIPGIELKGIYGANELLENNNHPNYKNKKVIVYGGGNVAMDAARTIKRLGAKEVSILYRRSLNEMPAEKKEIQEAQEEGINFIYQTNIITIIGKTTIKKIECLKTELVKDTTSERLIPKDIKDSNHTIETDILVTAIGSQPEERVINDLNLELDSNYKIVINEKNQTSNEKVFSGGEIANSPSTVAYAARSGRDASKSIIEYLKNKTSQ